MTSRASERAAWLSGAYDGPKFGSGQLEAEAYLRYPDDASPSPGERAIEALRFFVTGRDGRSPYVGMHSEEDGTDYIELDHDCWDQFMAEACAALAAADAERKEVP